LGVGTKSFQGGKTFYFSKTSSRRRAPIDGKSAYGLLCWVQVAHLGPLAGTGLHRNAEEA
jgi:hypothetical protein